MKKIVGLFVVTLLAIGAVSSVVSAAEPWKMVNHSIVSKFAKDVNPASPLPEYPRPQMVRDTWLNLNGLWDYAIIAREKTSVEKYDGQILVPFPVESALSGVAKKVGQENRLWYKRSVEIPKGKQWDGQRILLHFGAVDWETVVYVNGKEVGKHAGGYSPFSFDITHALKSTGSQEIVVAVWDPTNDGTQPRGKQVKDPRGIWYTSVTGIWQTVWLEPVPHTTIAALKMTPKFAASELTLETVVEGSRPGDVVFVSVSFGDAKNIVTKTQKVGESITLAIPNGKPWTPNEPNLYDLNVAILRGPQTVDTVESYFALRDITLGKTEDGITRMLLNGKFVFQHGPLDQGWWPDGLYTAPTDEALAYDVLVTKQMGFNMLRKHVKIESPRFYYHCDRLGMLVWQDLPNGDRHIRPQEEDIIRTPESAAIYEKELREMIATLYNAPSIVVWVPFNEGWGQFDTDRILALTKTLDPTRLVDGPSGWTDRKSGDLYDMHKYRGPDMFPPEENRATVLGEYGGLGLPIRNHLWVDSDQNWGYGGNLRDRDHLLQTYSQLNRRMFPLIQKGLSAAVYTQTTDVEVEVNGLLTYDREVIKMDVEQLKAVNGALHRVNMEPTTTLIPKANEAKTEWRFTTTKPQNGWETREFNDTSWQTGTAGFGRAVPRATIGTPWNTAEIWLRHSFDIKDIAALQQGLILLEMFHDEDVEVFLNGKKIVDVKGFTRDYELFPVTEQNSLKTGKNVLAIFCKQLTGAQYIDAGLYHIPPQGCDCE